MAPFSENLNHMITSTASNPQIAIDNSNNAIAIWVEENTGIDNIYTSYYSEAAGDQLKISTNCNKYCLKPSNCYG
jgi:hypothetical protein